jgi:hypothetical protein
MSGIVDTDDNGNPRYSDPKRDFFEKQKQFSQITGDDYPTYEDSVNATLAERNMYNRFDLEESISEMLQVGSDLDALIYAIGDSPNKYTEDELLNMLIGAKQLHETRHQKLCNIFESLVANKTIK